jgi:acyl-CoA hydrolase
MTAILEERQAAPRAAWAHKLITAEEAAARINPGDDVVVAQCASEPQGCMGKLHTAAPRVKDARVFSVVTLKPYDFYMKPEMKGHFELASWFHAPGSRQALAAGATIQLGIGGIPNARALALKGKKDLGVHTEMMVDSIMELYEAGVITNKRKALLKDKFVCTFAMGSRKLYDWLHENPAVEFRRGSWVNDPAVIRQNSRMVSINTCLAVDLTGQVASESIGPGQYSGTGGQTDPPWGRKKPTTGWARA